MSEAKSSPSTGKAGKRKFAPGSKVFAKVRGYPSWPARIDAIADEHPSRMKYHVYFYGTGETAVVKGEDVCSFIENKRRLGKPKKLSEALKQALEDLSDSERKLLAQFEEKGGSDTEDSLNTSSASAKQRRPSTSKTTTGQTPANKTSTTVSTPSATTPAPPPQGKRKRQDSSAGAKDSTPEDSSKSLVESDQNDTNSSLSRTGRVIKPPKKLVTEETDDITPPHHIENISLSTRPGPASKKMRLTEPSSDSGVDEGNDYIWAENPEGVKVKIPLKLATHHFKDPTMSLKWDEEALNQARTLKKELKDGKVKVTEVEAKMRNWMANRATEFEEKKVKCFEIEHDLLQIDYQIKGALSLKKADTEKCIDLLDKLRPLEVTTLMLKKHPEVVRTMKKIRHYVGNCSNWNMTTEETEKFERDAQTIRSKAENIYNKFRNLFISSDSTRQFWAYFSDEITKFEAKTKDLSSEEVFSLVYDP